MKRLSIESLRDGGFLLSDGNRSFGEPSQLVYAASTIGEIVEYVKQNFAPKAEEPKAN